MILRGRKPGALSKGSPYTLLRSVACIYDGEQGNDQEVGASEQDQEPFPPLAHHQGKRLFFVSFFFVSNTCHCHL